MLENFIHVPSLYGYYMALLYGSDWLFSCNDQALLARCPRHIQCVFNLIVDIPMDMLWSIDSCQKRVSADQCHMTVSRANYLLLVLIDCSLNYFLCFILIVLNRPYYNNK